MSGHSIERTSPKGGPFLGTCRLCGAQNLTIGAVAEECPNQRGLTQDEALIEAIDPSTKETPTPCSADSANTGSNSAPSSQAGTGEAAPIKETET